MKHFILYIYLLCTGLVFGVPAALAQPNITRVEYYMDNDPGLGLATELTIVPGTDLSNLTIPIDPGTLNSGVHRLYARAQNANGIWSLVSYWLFYKPYDGLGVPPPPVAPDINLVEYYIDNDPGLEMPLRLPFLPAPTCRTWLYPLIPEPSARVFIGYMHAPVIPMAIGAW